LTAAWSRKRIALAPAIRICSEAAGQCNRPAAMGISLFTIPSGLKGSFGFQFFFCQE